MFLIFSFANAYGAEIKFKTNSSDQSSALTTSTFKNQVSAGADFIASVNSVNRVYAGTSGLKFGTSSAAGDFTITLADAAQLKNPTITIASAKYKTESTSFEVYLNGATSANATIAAGATSGNSFTFSGIVTKIQIKSKGKRAYLSSITIEGEEGGSDLTPTSLAWSAETAIATIGADNTFPTLITTPTDLTGITYASSNTDIATIATDGTITLCACGVTTIMASFAGDDTHKVADDAKYTLTVVNPNAPEYQLFTGNLQAGEYVVYYNKVAMKAAVSSDRLGYETVNPIEDVIQTDNATIIWKIEPNGEYWTLYNTSAGKYAAGNGTKNQAALVSSVSDAALWTVTVSNGKFEFVNKKNAEELVNKNLRYNEGYGFACYGTSTGGALSLYKKADDANAISSPTISGADEFIESTEVTISAEDGLKVYYTLDGTDPTNASTEYTAPFELTATTTVKAVAYDGEKASDIISKTFKQLQVLTCVEAAGLCTATESADKYVVRGYVTELVDGGYNATYNNTNLWMADTKNGGQVLQAFRLIPVSNIEKTLVVGDYVEAIGSLVLWSDGTKEIKNGSIEKIVAPAEPEIEWMEMDLEITNLVTEVMEVEGAKFLQLMGRDDMNDADVTLFLNNYADVDDDYEVNAGSSYMTFGGTELTVLEGTMTQTSETEKGTIYTGTVRASAEEEGETMYLEFTLTMYAAPATVLVLTDAIVAINEELGTLTFNVPTSEDEGYYAELSGYTAPGVHQGPQICLFETPEVVSYTNYAETSVADGIITLKGEFTSPMGPKFNLTISGKLPGSATALDNLDTTVAPIKAIINGQLIIINNGVQYNAQGQVIK